MKKTYLIPAINVVEVKMQQHLLAGSGVETGSGVGNAYNSSDVSYGRGDSDWDED